MTVQIKTKYVYGKELIYPANDTAEMFLKLIDKKTFTVRELMIIKDMGYAIEQVHSFIGEVKNG